MTKADPTGGKGKKGRVESCVRHMSIKRKKKEKWNGLKRKERRLMLDCGKRAHTKGDVMCLSRDGLSKGEGRKSHTHDM